jgi:hypothetical protein
MTRPTHRHLLVPVLRPSPLTRPGDRSITPVVVADNAKTCSDFSAIGFALLPEPAASGTPMSNSTMVQKSD